MNRVLTVLVASMVVLSFSAVVYADPGEYRDWGEAHKGWEGWANTAVIVDKGNLNVKLHASEGRIEGAVHVSIAENLVQTDCGDCAFRSVGILNEGKMYVDASFKNSVVKGDFDFTVVKNGVIVGHDTD